MNRFSLAGKNAVVTGGSRGIGRAIAVGLAEAGADVVFTYRDKREEAETVAAQIHQLGRKALALRMDVTDRASVEEAARDAARFGKISILVNNAGINKPTDFDKVTDSDWDLILSTNLKGPFICAQVFLPLLADAGGGSIVHIGSVSGQYGGPRTAPSRASNASAAGERISDEPLLACRPQCSGHRRKSRHRPRHCAGAGRGLHCRRG